MTDFDRWHGNSFRGTCSMCQDERDVCSYSGQLGTISLCYVHAHDNRAAPFEQRLMAAVSLLFQELRKPKKPPKPRVPKLMHPTTKRK